MEQKRVPGRGENTGRWKHIYRFEKTLKRAKICYGTHNETEEMEKGWKAEKYGNLRKGTETPRNRTTGHMIFLDMFIYLLETG